MGYDGCLPSRLTPLEGWQYATNRMIDFLLNCTVKSQPHIDIEDASSFFM